MLVGGTASGVGKTTVTLALIACLRRRGLTVQAFKGGPDFLDTTHHTRISGRPARNLDTWMLGAEANRDVLRRSARGADAVIAEGMMGLFDGKSGSTETGSSAEVAKLLRLPVVLVLDCGSSARSVAAVVLGFERFDPELPLAGVILNRVAGERHYAMLREAIEGACRTPVLGWLPREPSIAIPERHLGLYAADGMGADGTLEGARDEAAALEAQIDTLARMAEAHLDVDRILELTCGLNVDEGASAALAVTPSPEVSSKLRLGVARDRAFSFYYEDNLDLLREQGVEVVAFSPTYDRELPAGLDGLYLGGGYPELEAERLAGNVTMLEQVRELAARNGVIYAECGGMIYLARTLRTLDGRIHGMAGVLPLAMEMTPRLVDFGYVDVEFTRDCLLGPQGTTIRGHSFHTSRISSGLEGENGEQREMRTSYRVRFSLSGKEQSEGFARGKVLASYAHLHFGANPAVVPHLIEEMWRAREARRVEVVRA
ncbi:MAG TPA: cobyrinate a,c-diamide synthase [Granulicella sp.]|nr:cobyrinate a,c-diamide synthase [Granulicella sp.]